MRANSPFTISGRGLGVFEGQAFGATPSFGRVYSGFMGDFGSPDPGPMTSMPGVRQSVPSEMFGLGEDALFGDEGLFGDELFGLGQAMIADPMAAKNAPLVEIAKAKIAEYDASRRIVEQMRTDPTKQDQYAGAMAIISKGWYRNDSLDALRTSIANRIPSGAFYQLVVEGTSTRISDTGAKRLEAFRSGNAKLRGYLRQFVVLPTEVTEKQILVSVGMDAASLYAKAEAAAQKARASRQALDAAAARGLADAALSAAEAEGHEGVMASAKLLFDEMDALARELGVARVAPTPMGGEIPWVPIAIGGGVLALGLVVYLALK